MRYYPITDFATEPVGQPNTGFTFRISHIETRPQSLWSAKDFKSVARAQFETSYEAITEGVIHPPIALPVMPEVRDCSF